MYRGLLERWRVGICGQSNASHEIYAWILYDCIVIASERPAVEASKETVRDIMMILRDVIEMARNRSCLQGNVTFCNLIAEYSPIRLVQPSCLQNQAD